MIRALQGLIAILSSVNRFFEYIGQIACVVLVALMTAVVLLQVFFRYVLNDSLSWSEESAIIMMIWMAFLAAPIAYRSGSNVAIEMFSSMLKGRLQFILQVALHLLVLWILWRFWNEALAFVDKGAKFKANSLPIKMRYVYLIVPYGFGTMILVGLELILRNIIGSINPSAYTPPPPLPIMQAATEEARA